MTEVQQLPVDSLHPSTWNRDVGDVTELAESIRTQGILQPIVARPNANGFQIVMGERRWTAAKLAGIAEVPVIVRELDDNAALEAQLVENLQRKDIEPLEEAQGFRLMLELGLKQKEISERLGVSPAHVSKRLALLVLPDVAQKALSAGKVTLEDAYELVRLKDHPDRIAKVLKDRSGIPWAIRREVQDIADAEKKEKAKQRAEAEGIKLVAFGGATPLKRDGFYNALPFTKTEHKKEPCHAAAISPAWNGHELVYVCTDAKRHGPKGDSTLKRPKEDEPSAPRETAAQKKDRIRREALRDRRTARKAFIAELVQNLAGRKVSKDEILDQVSLALVRSDYDSLWSARVDAVVALGLMSQEAADDDPDQAVEDTIEAFIGKSAGALRRFALANALCATESVPYSDEPPWTIDFLVRHGYELSDVERESFEAAK